MRLPPEYIDETVQWLEGAHNSGDYPELYQSHNSWIHHALKMVEKHKGKPTSGERIAVDLGGGFGLVGLRMANEGYRTISIDYDEKAVGSAELETNPFDKSPGSLEIYLGNYFPPEMINDEEGMRLIREANKHLLPKKTKALERRTNPGWENPYRKAGIKFSDVDLFYSYPYDLAKSIVHAFANYAKPGANLIMVPVFDKDYKLPENVELKDQAPIFQKVHLLERKY